MGDNMKVHVTNKLKEQEKEIEANVIIRPHLNDKGITIIEVSTTKQYKQVRIQEDGNITMRD